VTSDGLQFNLADLYECVADAAPERMALVAGEARLRYRELDERSNRLAHHLEASGNRPGDWIGILAQNRAEWIESMLAAYKMRAAPINLNFRYVDDELRYVLDDADLVTLIFERRFAPRLLRIRESLPKLRHFICLEDGSDADVSALGAVAYEAALAAASPARGFGPRSPDDLYVLYTGGTTGMPKGTLWRQEDIFFAALGGGNFGGEPIRRPEAIAGNAAKEPRATLLAIAPMMHGGGQWTTFNAFFAANTLVLYTGASFDPNQIWRLVERERVTSLSIVGDAMGRPLAEALAAPGANFELSSLAIVGSGGAILSKAVKQQLREQLPKALILDSFGASETGYNGTVLDLAGPPAGPRFTLHEETTVLGDDGRPLAPGSGVVGRLARRGHVPLGYHKDPVKTAQTFPVIDGVRWVIPGDFATLEADGTLVLLGRGSVCINSGGEKIYPEEVEAALKSHPDVFDAVAVGVPDARFGERVAALVTPRPGRAPSLEELASHCRERIAGYKVPRALVCVDEIVRTPAGKPDYRWAKRRALEG
jgi:fatty-acyl-CoA synthase